MLHLTKAHFHVTLALLAAGLGGCMASAPSASTSPAIAPPPEASAASAFEEQQGIIKDGPPFALTTKELLGWTPESASVDPRNISTVPLAARFVDPETQLDQQVKVLFAPDGVNNFGNYLIPQDKFNLYNFTHWSQIDILNWFSGASAVNLPPRPWVEAAHRNGVKVIGTVFFAPVVYGGKPEKVEAFLVQRPDGSFPAADRLIALARFYGFDGWLMNEETDLTEVKTADGVVRDPALAGRAAETGAKMQAFMAYLTAKAPEGMEIHWYDAMLPNGQVKWQNELNKKNVGFLQAGDQRVSDAIFLNYWWNEARIARSEATAAAVRRSRYDVYFGADLWPARTNNQAAFRNVTWLAKLFSADGTRAKGSIALFAPNFNFDSFNDSPELRTSRFRDEPSDYDSYQDAETRLFAGDDLNLLRQDNMPGAHGLAAEPQTALGPAAEPQTALGPAAEPQTALGPVAEPQTAWEGVGRYVPARSPLTALPFETNFNTGHGRRRFARGRAVAGPWHDMARQDVQPQFLFGKLGEGDFRARFDFDHAYNGGSALHIAAQRQEAGEARFPLFLTRFRLDGKRKLSAAYSISGCGAAALELRLADGRVLPFPLVGNSAVNQPIDWQVLRWPLADASGAELVSIGVTIADHSATSSSPPSSCADNKPVALLLGQIAIR